MHLFFHSHILSLYISQERKRKSMKEKGHKHRSKTLFINLLISTALSLRTSSRKCLRIFSNVAVIFFQF